MANNSNNGSDEWYFTKEQLENTPSRKCGFNAHKELSYRQQAANFIQDMGQRLKVSQLCINTAIVYMHRFYVFHSFTHFPWYQMAAAALFLAAKVEEQPRKLEYVIRVANICRNPKDTSIDVNSERYLQQSQDLVFNENVLLQTLGFHVAIDHPHTHVVRCCHLVRASKDLAQTSYFMASNSLHLTTMCIQYRPTVVACFCILVACKWSNWEIPLSNEKKEWYSYVDSSVTAELLQQLTEEFLVIFESCPSRLKEKIMAISDKHLAHDPTTAIANSPFDTDPKQIVKEEGKNHQHRSSHESSENNLHKHRSSRPHEASSSSQQQQQQQRERDRNRDRERLAAQQKALMSGQSKVPHGHHRPPIDQKLKPPHSRPPSSSVSNYIPGGRQEPRDILREASKDSPFGLASKDYREHKDVRSDKDMQKRDYLLKPNVQTDTNNYSDSRLVSSSSSHSGEKRVEPNRVKMDPNKVPSKHENVRRPDDTKVYLKLETENIKKHLSASSHEKNNAFFSKPLTVTSIKMDKNKSPSDPDTSKSVLKPSLGQVNALVKPQNLNGNDGSYSRPIEDLYMKTDDHYLQTENSYNKTDDLYNKHDEGYAKNEGTYVKSETLEIKQEPIDSPPIIKRPSLFSPEQTPPHKKAIKTEPEIKNEPLTPSFSPLSSPLTIKRNRNCSTSSSEPELRPVIKKIDQIEGFENLIRDTTIGINKLNSSSDMVSSTNTQIKQKSYQNSAPADTKVSDTVPISNSEKNSTKCTVVNGLETNPSIISNLLKTAIPPHLASVSANNDPNLVQQDAKKDHHHKAKKKKEKHRHKTKKEDKEKKRKHKDKDREKHKHREAHQEIEQPPMPAEPIKIKIQKDRIQSLVPESSTPSQGLKIKIPKDKIKTEAISELNQPPPIQPSIGIKLKIPKEKLNNCVGLETNSKKRERERTSMADVPPSKMARMSHKNDSSKQNGRHSYNKVAQSGDGDTSLHRLAESKYTHKSSTS